ncbi:MAG: substrate-binding domain-containing protein [Opitutaceae bacterium]|nr:substrate-binding domain-containing protein [Opitutaceae bacterium]
MILPKINPAIALLLAASGLFVATANARPPAPKPPTAADAAFWRQNGRTLPTPEVLQPTIDPALPAYVPRKDIELSGSFKGACSDVLPGVAKRWIAAFQKYYPKVQIEVPPPYSGRYGAGELVKGDRDFALVSRELIPTDVEGFTKKFGYPPLSVPIMGGSYRHFGFLDAIGVFVNKDNPIDKISFAQLDAILSTTRHRGLAPITKWGQLGLTGEWADKPIHVWAIKPWNGFEEFVRQRVLMPGSQRGEWREDLNFTPTVFPVSPAVAKDPYAIGYAGIAYVGEDVKLIALQKDPGGPFVPPSYEEVALANYPLSRLVFLNVNKAPGKPLNPALEEFIRFILSKEGQQCVLDQQLYIPLRAEQAKTSRALLVP